MALEIEETKSLDFPRYSQALTKESKHKISPLSEIAFTGFLGGIGGFKFKFNAACLFFFLVSSVSFTPNPFLHIYSKLSVIL